MFALLMVAALLAPREPEASDLIRFPPLEMAELALAEQTQARELFERRLLLAIPESDDQRWWQSALYECERLHEAWRALVYARQANQEWGDDSRWPVRCLRDELTPLEWRTGQMPPMIPDWRFR